MNARRIFAIAAIALGTAFATISTPTLSAESWKQWQPEFQSEHDMKVSAYSAKEAAMLRDYGLRPRFTAGEYGAAVAEKAIRDIRQSYNLGPDFTSADIAAAAGAREVSRVIKEYKLPTHFNSDDFHRAAFVRSMGWVIERYPSLSFPFSAEEYVKASGADAALDIAQKYKLRTDWVFSDLVRAAGPMEAGVVRYTTFAQDATHEQIEQGLGQARLKTMLYNKALSPNWTKQDMADNMPSSGGYNEFADMKGPFTDATLVVFYGNRAVAEYSRRYNLQGPFTEDQLRKAISAQAIVDAQNRYSLGANFTGADIALSWAISEVMSVRLQYDLREDFSAAEYRAAFEAAQRAAAERRERFPFAY